MKYITFLFLIFGLSFFACNQSKTVYSNSYGDSTNPVILFIHGGPGGSSFFFEKSVAQELSDAGYYVVTYDQRGSGRSIDIPNSKYTFDQSYKDINAIYKKYNIKTASIVGHSWGGMLGIKYSLNNLEKVNSLTLVCSPLSFQRINKTILKKCREIYTKNKSPKLKHIETIEGMDTFCLEYSNNCFQEAVSNNFYFTKNANKQAVKIMKCINQDSVFSHVKDPNIEPMYYFHKNEKITTIDFYNDLVQAKKKLKIYGIYGFEDGLFDAKHYQQISDIIGEQNMTIIDSASHYVYIEQQEEFLDCLTNYLKK